VGVDTEFIRVRTFFPIAAIYQLAGEDEVALVDAQAPARFTALRSLLLDPERTKIVHACSEDLEVMACHLDVRPVNLVDTQLAHAFLGGEFSTSYAKLVEHYLGVGLGKHETRSDWLQRPLSDEQLAYAREDAAYLVPIWRRQQRDLVARDRLSWFTEEMDNYLGTPIPSPETWYRTLKGAWRLKGRELGVLRELVRWREDEARRRDLPRAYTVRDEHLLALAGLERIDVAEVKRLLPRRTAQRYARILVKMHRAGLQDPDPPERVPGPLTRRGGETVKRLRAIARREAERLDLAPELLARKRELEADYRYYRERGTLPPRYEGWRGALLRNPFLEALAAE